MANGLLDFAQSPEGQGLLAAAFSGLANARKGAPLNTIGAAGLGGLQGYSGALDRQTQQANQSRQNEFQTLQMEKMRRDMNAPPERTKSIQEFEYAKQQGYKGEYPEFLRDMGAAQPYYTPIPTEQGYMSFNSRSGGWAPMLGAGGRPVIPAAQSPTLQGQIAGAKTAATETAKKEAEAAFDAPTAIAKGQEALGLVDDLLKAPGFNTAVGTSRMFGLHKIPGTDARNFDIRLDQIKGQQFLQAFETLKGGGQITEVEGRKATDAISRMNPEASEQEFTKAAEEFKEIIQRGIARAQKMGGMPAPSAAAPMSSGAPKAGTVQDGYRFKGGNPADPKSWEKL